MLPDIYLQKYKELERKLYLFKPESFGSPWHKKTSEEFESLKQWVEMYESFNSRKASGTLEDLAKRIQDAHPQLRRGKLPL